MPKVKRSRKPPPDGWELIEPTLDELDQKMREGESTEKQWPSHNVNRALVRCFQPLFVFLHYGPVAL